MRRRFAAGVIVLAAWCATPASALACSCMGGMPVCEQFWFGADEFPRTIFEATVVSITDELGPEYEGRRYPIKRVRLTQLRGWKGEPEQTITTGAGNGDCGYRFEVGRRYVIDAFRSPASGSLSAGICSLTRPLEEAGELLVFLESLDRPSPGGRAFGTVQVSSHSSDLGQPDRTPLEGVRVLLHGPRSGSITTGVDGTYAFGELPPGQYQLSVEIEGRPELRVPPPEEFSIANAHACHRSWVNLPVNGVIEGSVVDAAGGPVANVSVGLRPAEQPRDTMPNVEQGRSDELGRFAFDELAPGRYVVGVNLPLGPNPGSPYAVTYAMDASGVPEIIELGLGALHQLRPLVVTRLELTKVAGQVLWADGSPAAGCRVSASPLIGDRPGLGLAASDTGPEGRFQLDVFRGVRYRFRADNCTSNEVEVDRIGGDGFVQLVLSDRR
jgi:hypothetical protein